MTGGTIPVLVYHSVSDEASSAYQRYTVSPARFAEHVTLLRDLGYVGLTMSDAAQRLFSGLPLPPRAVVLTFDDAFHDFAQHAFPTLMDAGFVATLFVPTAYVGSTSTWLVAEGEERRPVMTWSEIQGVANAGIEVGAHSHTHPQLDRLPRSELVSELATSKTRLEGQLGRSITTVAYPFGFHSRSVRQAARAAGYTSACAVGNLPATGQSDRWAIPRQTVTDTADHLMLRQLLTRESRHYDRTVSEAKRVIWRLRRAFA